MASVSISLTAATIEGADPADFVVGSSVPGVGDIEIRVNTANITSLMQIRLALEAAEDFVGDQNYGPSTFKVL